MAKDFYITNDAVVDNEKWYTIIANREAVAKWLRNQGCYQHTTTLNMFDVSEETAIMLKLKWPV